MKLAEHELSECMLVWFHPYLEWDDTWKHGEEICVQGYCDLKYEAINNEEARQTRHGPGRIVLKRKIDAINAKITGNKGMLRS